MRSWTLSDFLFERKHYIDIFVTNQAFLNFFILDVFKSNQKTKPSLKMALFDIGGLCGIRTHDQ